MLKINRRLLSLRSGRHPYPCNHRPSRKSSECHLLSVKIATRNDCHCVCLNFVNQAVFLRNSARPHARQAVFQWFWFTWAIKRCPIDRRDKSIDFSDRGFITLLKPTDVVAPGIVSLALNYPHPRHLSNHVGGFSSGDLGLSTADFGHEFRIRQNPHRFLHGIKITFIHQDGSISRIITASNQEWRGGVIDYLKVVLEIAAEN